MQQYEITILYHPSLEVGLSKAEEQIQKIITSNEGKVTGTDNWGKRKLAYPIAKQDFAIYVFYTVELAPDKLRKVETALNLADEVIRYLIVKPDLKAAAAAEQEKVKKAAEESKRESSRDNVEESQEEE